MKTNIIIAALAMMLAACGGNTSDQSANEPTSSAAPAKYNHLMVGTYDTQRMAKWYEKTLGARIVQQYASGQRQISLYGKYWQLMPIDSSEVNTEVVGGIFKVGYRTEGLQTLRDSLENMGVTLHGNLVYDKNLEVYTFLITDPEGNRVQFFGPKEGTPQSLDWMFAAIRLPNMEADYPYITETLGFEEIHEMDAPDRNFKIRLLQRDDLLLEIIEDPTVPAPGSSALGYWSFTVSNIPGSTADNPLSDALSYFSKDSE